MSTQQFAIIVIMAANSLVAAYVLIKNSRNILNRVFFLFVFGMAVWGIGIVILFITRIFFFNKIIFFGGTIAVLGFVLLSKTFPDGRPIERRFLLYLLPFSIIFILISFDLFVKGIIILSDGYVEPVLGRVFPLYAIIMSAYVILGLFLFLKKYRGLSGIKRLQAQYLFLGAFVFIVAALIFNVFLPVFGIYQLNPLGPMASIIFIGFTAYAIIRHQLMDIRIVIQRSLLYSLTIGIIVGIYMFIIFILEGVFRRAVGGAPLISAVIAAIVVVIGFPYLKRWFQRVTDKIFFKGVYNYQEVLRELSRALNSIIDLKELSDSVSEILLRVLKLNKILFLLRGKRDSCLIIKNKNFTINKKDINKECRDFLIKFLEANKGIIAHQELQYKIKSMPKNSEERKSQVKIKRLLEKLEAAALIPIVSRGRLAGIFMLGKKLSGDAFYRRDIELLDTFSHQAGVAIENAKLYEEVKSYSEHLEEKVKERTKELKRLYDVQSKFMTDISHQLQTPLSVIKGNVGIVYPRVRGHRDCLRALDAINKTTDRASRLVHDLLVLAKADFGQQQLDMKSVSLNNLIRELYEQSKILAEDKKINFRLQEKDQLIVSGDREKLKELFLNLISNAIKYTPPGGKIEVVLYKDGKQAPRRSFAGQAKIEVSDTGRGIPNKDLPHIFERFYRIERKEPREEEGTGLGLAICQWIVQAHKGTIVAKSKLGKGSKFIVSLPRK